MGTPQFFEIPSTGIYRSPDGSVSYYYAEGAIIPMALAIALGIEGAAYDAVPVFDAAQVAAIEALVAEGGGGGGGGGGVTFPMAEGRWYDNSTAMAGALDAVTGVDLSPNEINAGLVYISEDNASISSIGIRTIMEDSGRSIRVGLYSIQSDGANAGLPDNLIGSSVVIPITEPVSGAINTVTCDIAVPGKGWYYFLMSGSHAGLKINAFGGAAVPYSGPIGTYVWGYQASPVHGFGYYSHSGAFTALPATVQPGLTLDYGSYSVPFVLFQITHD